jgi:RHS repeat-associated protein
MNVRNFIGRPRISGALAALAASSAICTGQLIGTHLHRADGGCQGSRTYTYPNSGSSCTNVVIYEGAINGYNTCNVIFTNIVRPPWGGADDDTWVAYRIESSSTAAYNVDYTTTLSSGASNVVNVISSPNHVPGHVAFSVAAVADSTVESDETVKVYLIRGPYSDTVVPELRVATVTIRDDTPGVCILTTNTYPFEGGASVFRFYRTNSYEFSSVCAVHYTVTGTAVKNTDYTAATLTGTATIPAGQGSVDVPINATADSVFDASETITVTLTSGGYQIVPGQGTATITILDATSAVAVGNTNSLVFEGGKTAIRFYRTNCYTSPPSPPRTVSYSVSGASGEYTASPVLSGSVYFPAGVSAVTNVITATPDTLVDGDHTLTVTLTGGNTTYQVIPGYDSTSVDILDGTAAVGVLATNPIVVEGGQTELVFYRSNAYATPPSPGFSLSYEISGNADGTYTASPPLTGSIQFPAGAAEAYTSITVPNDQSVNGTRTLTLTLTGGGTTYQIIPGEDVTTVGILDDSPTISVVASNAYAWGANSPGTFVINRSGAMSGPVTVNYTVSGTAQPGSYSDLPTSVTLAADQAATTLVIWEATNPSSAQTIVLTLSADASYLLGGQSQAVVTLLPQSATTNSIPSPVGRYHRGSGSDPNFWSIIVPLNYQTGANYDNVSGNCATLYPGLTSWTNATLYHLNATNSLSQPNPANRIAFNNPIAAFGERVGGTPLYPGQPYSFGIYAGTPYPTLLPLSILAYARSNFALVGAVNISPPTPYNSNSWTDYVNSGHRFTTNAHALKTTLADTPNLTWGTTNYGAWVLTHEASDASTNYFYVVQASGYVDSQSNTMVTTSGGAVAPSLLYSLEFALRPQFRSVFLDQPHFDGKPLPPFYAGKTLPEILTNAPPVTNTVALAPSTCTNLDDSPELRRHPALDQFVADMGNDPVALANYVLNEIDLTDPIDYNENGNVAEEAINPGGVSRGALGVFMEQQGSPVEQCALLVYLLRQAGVPAAYVLAPHNGMQILDARLSRMLKFQIHGAFNEAGRLHTTNTMIPVNYTWVAAYTGTNWVHIFPWLKDYELDEGLDLYAHMPPNYPTAHHWVRDYVHAAPDPLSLAVDDDNTPGAIFPRFLTQTLAQNHPGVSLDDLGTRVINRRHHYPRWEDFPRPTWLTNTSFAVKSLADPAITNVSPLLTNIFDTLSVEIYSVTDPTKRIQTGALRLADLHNRQFYVTQSNTGPTEVQLSLILAPFRSNVLTQASFSDDPALLSKQALGLALDRYDDALSMRLKYSRHRAITAAYPIDPTRGFLGLSASREAVVERPFNKGDIAALCLNYGRVTRNMVRAHAMQLWQMQSALRIDPSLTNSLSPDLYQGALMTACGMQYYQKNSEFDELNLRLHKLNRLSLFAMGLSKIGPRRDSYGYLADGKVDPVLPNVDMIFHETALAGNGSHRLDSGHTEQTARRNYFVLSIADGSAQEHQALNGYYEQSNAVSTVRLLQLAQTRGLGIVELNYTNYLAQGETLYQDKSLQSHDPGLWSSIVTAFNGWDRNYVVAYMTPGPVTNAAYKGMGALILGWSLYQALITPGMNGAFAEQFPRDYSVSPWGAEDWLSSGGDTISFNVAPSDNITLMPGQTASYDWQRTFGQMLDGNYTFSEFDLASAHNTADLLGAAYGSSLNQFVANTVQASEQASWFDRLTDMGSQALSKVFDPVHAVTGEFYVDETDLSLPGPLPLALRRNYSSQNLADNQFGPGWKLSLMPYLSVGEGATNIYAADMDGAVLNYVRTATNASVWLPTPAANPQLVNNTEAGAGGLVNRLRDRLVQTVNGSVTNYALYGADGSVRLFKVMTFDNGILNQTRPYLLQWTDSRGNFYTFAYGTNPSLPDFGQVRRIQCSNGNYLGFYFDIYGHIIEAYSGDGRRVLYVYDLLGDLITVTLPDRTTRQYAYAHSTQAVTNGSVVTQQPYSTHLLVEENKPDGRVLVNIYDSQRRATNQLSAAGADLTPVRTASFVYANNFNLTNYYTNQITGYTLVIDGYNRTNRYDYSNGLITKVTDPLGQTIEQSWYPDNATAPGYPRSVSLRKDKRGLSTQFLYDSSGNVTNSIVTGDLTGGGILTQTATNRATYNANCLPTQTVDPAGNGTVIVYDSSFVFLPQQVIRYAGAAPLSTNFITYGSVTNTFAQGGTTQTNLARGLPIREIRAYGSPDAATNDVAYDGHGFRTQTIAYTGTSDPALTNWFFYNERGQMVDHIDGAGALLHFEHDAMGRQTEQWAISEDGELLSWNFTYYNDNGELQWTDGPAYGPEDYVWCDYDGAGRLSTEIRWRAEAKPDGTGVQAPSGYDLYAQSFFEYDLLGNRTRAVNPRGAATTNAFDALNRLAKRSSLETNGAVLATETFSYEPGGLERFHTNAIGGITQTEYTTTGQPRYRLNPDGSTNAWRYYLDGRVRRDIQRNGAYWETTYEDASRESTKIFYTAAGTALATNSTALDRRGNPIETVDAAFNVFTNFYDGLNRLRVAAGPSTTVVSSDCGADPFCGRYVTNVLRQMTTRLYDAANRTLVVSNALGEKTVTATDMLGRVKSVQTFAADAATPLRVTTTSYSPDHHSFTVTEGSGANSVVSTTFTDNDGNTVLSVGYPETGKCAFTRREFDLAGNMVHEERDSSSGGTVTLWTQSDYAFDGLNRMVGKTDRDSADMSLAYDPANNLTNRTMPGGLKWSAVYNSAGQQLQNWLVGTDGSGTMSNTFAYHAAGHPAAGLLYTRTDGRGTIATNFYDHWLRLTNTTRSIGSPYGNLTTIWAYDVRGLATNITEMNYGDATGSDPKVVCRTFDAYGQIVSETVTLNGNLISSAGQAWDVAGRRTLLALNSRGASMNYGYTWQADGLEKSVVTSVGGAMFGYNTAGLLSNRAAMGRSTLVNSRDGMGRPLSVSTTVNTQEKLIESLSWTGDGLLAGHTLWREDFTDQRSYDYAALSRRLIEEHLNLDSGNRWTNSFAYDGGASAGIGLLTSAGKAGAASWAGGISPLGRVNTETNTLTRYTATGRVNGRATLSAALDGRPVPVSFGSTSDYSWTNRWMARMELTPGTHQLSVSAAHPSGFFTTNASVWFTNQLAQETAQIYRNGAGSITRRIWKAPDGSTNRMQYLYWDGKQRLCQVTEFDKRNPGSSLWLAEYDGLDRLLCTTWYPGDASSIQIYGVLAQTNLFVYDPQVEFMELGVYVGPSGKCSNPGQMTWKLCGPDLNGRYGGMNGVGGLEAVATGMGYFLPTLSDSRGNILATLNPQLSTLDWLDSRPTGYGAVPGYRPLPLGHGGNYVQSAAWKGKWADVTGYIWRGARFYDPVAGMWLSPDPQWNDRDASYWSYAGGDPINSDDWDGRCLQSANAQAGAFEDSFINGTVSLAQMAHYGVGNWLDMPHLVSQGEMLEGLKSPMQRLGAYEPGSFDSHIGESAAMVAGAYGLARQIPSITSRIGNWIESFGSRPATPAISTPRAEYANWGGEFLDDFPVSQPLQPQSPMVTVLGSGRNVRQYAGRPGFNVLNMDNLPQAEWPRQNALWLNEAVRRNDDFWLVTDPASHSAFLSNLPDKPQSFYLNLELPMLEQYTGVNVIPKYPTLPK